MKAEFKEQYLDLAWTKTKTSNYLYHSEETDLIFQSIFVWEMR